MKFLVRGIFITVVTFFFGVVQAEVLHRQEAYELLKEHGLKWKLTKTSALEAEAKALEAESKFNPQFALGMSQFAGRINPIQYGVNNQVIDTIGYGSTALEFKWTVMDPVHGIEKVVAETQSDMTQIQSKQFQNELIALMLAQYLAVQRLQKQVETQDEALKRSQTIFKLANAKKAVGAGIPLDISRATTLVEGAKIKKLQAYLKLLKAKHELAVTLGQKNIGDNFEPLAYLPFKSAKLKNSLAYALDDRQDLKALKRGVASAKNVLEETKGFFFPKIDLLGQVGTTRTTFFGWPAETASGIIGVHLTIPLDTGGLLDAKRKEAAAVTSKAIYQEEQLRLEIENQTKESVEQLMAAEEGVHAALQLVRSATEETELAEKRFFVGAGNALEASNAHNNLISALDTETEAISVFEAAKINYYRTVGSFDEYFEQLR